MNEGGCFDDELLLTNGCNETRLLTKHFARLRTTSLTTTAPFRNMLKLDCKQETFTSSAKTFKYTTTAKRSRQRTGTLCAIQGSELKYFGLSCAGCHLISSTKCRPTSLNLNFDQRATKVANRKETSALWCQKEFAAAAELSVGGTS